MLLKQRISVCENGFEGGGGGGGGGIRASVAQKRILKNLEKEAGKEELEDLRVFLGEDVFSDEEDDEVEKDEDDWNDEDVDEEEMELVEEMEEGRVNDNDHFVEYDDDDYSYKMPYLYDTFQRARIAEAIYLGKLLMKTAILLTESAEKARHSETIVQQCYNVEQRQDVRNDLQKVYLEMIGLQSSSTRESDSEQQLRLHRVTLAVQATMIPAEVLHCAKVLSTLSTDGTEKHGAVMKSLLQMCKLVSDNIDAILNVECKGKRLIPYPAFVGSRLIPCLLASTFIPVKCDNCGEACIVCNLSEATTGFHGEQCTINFESKNAQMLCVDILEQNSIMNAVESHAIDMAIFCRNSLWNEACTGRAFTTSHDCGLSFINQERFDFVFKI